MENKYLRSSTAQTGGYWPSFGCGVIAMVALWASAGLLELADCASSSDAAFYVYTGSLMALIACMMLGTISDRASDQYMHASILGGVWGVILHLAGTVLGAASPVTLVLMLLGLILLAGAARHVPQDSHGYRRHLYQQNQLARAEREATAADMHLITETIATVVAGCGALVTLITCGMAALHTGDAMILVTSEVTILGAMLMLVAFQRIRLQRHRQHANISLWLRAQQMNANHDTRK